jgi:hypothetical protein
MDAPSKRRGKILAAHTCSISPTTYTHMHCETLSRDFRKAYSVCLEPHFRSSYLLRHLVDYAIYKQRSKSTATYSPMTQRRVRLRLHSHGSGLLDPQVMDDDTRLLESRLFQQDKTAPHHLRSGHVKKTPRRQYWISWLRVPIHRVLVRIGLRIQFNTVSNDPALSLISGFTVVYLACGLQALPCGSLHRYNGVVARSASPSTEYLCHTSPPTTVLESAMLSVGHTATRIKSRSCSYIPPARVQTMQYRARATHPVGVSYLLVHWLYRKLYVAVRRVREAGILSEAV